MKKMTFETSDSLLPWKNKYNAIFFSAKRAILDSIVYFTDSFYVMCTYYNCKNVWSVQKSQNIFDKIATEILFYSIFYFFAILFLILVPYDLD